MNRATLVRAAELLEREAEGTWAAHNASAENDKAEPWSSIKYLLDSYPGSIRVRPGGGMEELLGSLCATFIKLREAVLADRAAPRAEGM